MAIDKTDEQIKLKDGRMPGYGEYGTVDDKPVFYFPGHPAAQLDWLLLDADDSATELTNRISAVDRRGTGISDSKPHREILDWPDDVVELADVLQPDRFAVLGISESGPYAAACAFKLPERLTATAIVCGAGPSEAPGVKEGMSSTYATQPPDEKRQMLMGMAGVIRENPHQILSQMKQAPFPEKDKELMDQPELSKMIMELAFGEALRSGIDGFDQDAAIYARPWGFQPKDITGEVQLWHGEQDINVGVSVGRYVAGAIPNCDATFFPEEGHFSIAHSHSREILNVLLG